MTALGELAGELRASRKAPARAPWRPPQIADLAHHTRVLCFDATLTHCGWACIEAVPGEILVHGSGTINIETGCRGYMETWDKARQLQRALATPLRWCQWPGTQLVVEAPLARNANRFESTLVAGLLVYLSQPECCHPVSATHVSRVMLGDARVRSAERKKQIREAVIRLVPAASGRGWNEHSRDAVATGITFLIDRKPGQVTPGAGGGAV